MNQIELQIFWNGEDNTALENLGIEDPTPLSEFMTRPVTFYNIDSISPYQHNKKYDEWHSRVNSGNQEYICNLKYNQLKKLIEANNNG